MTDDLSSRSLAVVESMPMIPVPIYSGPQMTTALVAYRQLQLALDRGMPEQIMSIRGKPFRKKGYWRAIRTAFALTVECRTEERRELHDDWGWVVTYRATAPTGRFADGDGSCFASEKSRGQMEATEHNVRSHAHTRAFNRAVSNLVGFGEVSAEEVIQDERSATPVTRATPSKSITGPQQRRIFAIAKDAQWTESALRSWLRSQGIVETKRIPPDRYEAICTALAQGPAVANAATAAAATEPVPELAGEEIIF